MREALAAYLGTDVASVDRITTGHSRAMYKVTLADGDRVVVRVEQGGVFGTSSAAEFELMRGLHAAGYPVAGVRSYEPTGDVVGRPFFVMDYVEGDAQAREERGVADTVAEHFVQTLADLHQVDWAAAGIVFEQVPATPDQATHQQIDRWAGVYRDAADEPIPLLEEAAAWLHHYAPPLDRLSVVHADAGPGNFIHRDGKVVAVTDWEFAHLGDPREDWVYVIAMRGSRSMSPDEWRDLFERVAGVTLSTADLHYWEAFNLFKGACANVTALALFQSGANPAPNMLMVGTTLHQLFLRRLVDLTDHAKGAPT